MTKTILTVFSETRHSKIINNSNDNNSVRIQRCCFCHMCTAV